MKKIAQYTTTSSYETLNELTKNTKNVWLVFHGISYLSRFFLRYFHGLNPEENYIICPQAPAKYYKDTNYKHVGASWLTKEDTQIETENVLNYIDAVIENEGITSKHNLIVLGYSQGVSIASRWIGKRKRQAEKLICVSGVFPVELKAEDFTHCPKLKVIHSVGSNDEIFDPKNVKKQEERMLQIFPQTQFINHEFGHKLQGELLDNYLNY